ncbi:hypothetical protein E2C01_099332 [Portunus trituberculatus]|uniref:Uncharacterized protein n=1 Tax=Portunus trituberculatus TaxID=210409 RepID=A0A5B7KGL3_PORTR|nr:hypothetical protein [Portunus trituberculatus]
MEIEWPPAAPVRHPGASCSTLREGMGRSDSLETCEAYGSEALPTNLSLVISILHLDAATASAATYGTPLTCLPRRQRTHAQTHTRTGKKTATE